MSVATTEKFEEMVLEVSDDGNTWRRLCGFIDVTVTRTANVDTAEIPDCDDESKPLSVERQVRSLDVSATGTGVWAQESNEEIISWIYSGATKHCRIGNLKAAVGDTEYEQGMALLTSVSDSRTKGQKVSRDIEVQFDGVPSLIAKAAP